MWFSALLFTLLFAYFFENKNFRILVLGIFLYFILMAIADDDLLVFGIELLVILSIIIILGIIGIRMKKKEKRQK